MINDLTLDVVQEAIKRATEGDSSQENMAFPKRICRMMHNYLAKPILVTRQWQQTRGYLPLPLQWIHGISKGVPKPSLPALPENTRPLTLLNYSTTIISTAIVIPLEDTMSQSVPVDQTGFMRGRSMTPQIHAINQLIQNTLWGPDAWFLEADLMKAFDKISFLFLGLALRHAKVPLLIIRWILSFFMESLGSLETM